MRLFRHVRRVHVVRFLCPSSVSLAKQQSRWKILFKTKAMSEKSKEKVMARSQVTPLTDPFNNASSLQEASC